MLDADQLARSFENGKKALGQLKRLQLEANPENYELFYIYATAAIAKLNQQLNQKLTDDGAVTQSYINDLICRFIERQQVNEHLDNISCDMTNELNQLLHSIKDTSNASTEYKSSLENAQDTLNGEMERNQLAEIVENLISSTQASITRNAELEKQLNESQERISDLQGSLETVRKQSLTDQLTGLFNRKYFDDSMDNLIDECGKNNGVFSLLMTDIDHFKSFNDKYGHQTGDKVLKVVAQSLKQNIKGQDIACRYGGEEFAIILPNTTLEQSEILAEKIREVVQAKELVNKSSGQNLGRVTLSIGCAEFAGNDNVETIIERADKCLYAAKKEGRNRVITENYFKEQMTLVKSA